MNQIPRLADYGELRLFLGKIGALVDHALVVEECVGTQLCSEREADAHADGVQMRGGKHCVFKGNNFDMPSPGTPGFYGGDYKSNSPFMLDAATGPTDNILIEGNWLNGGNYTVYSVDTGGTGCPTNVRVINNQFGRDNGGWPDRVEARIRTGCFAQWSGNVWEDNGQPCP